MWWNVVVDRGEFIRPVVLASICDDYEKRRSSNPSLGGSSFTWLTAHRGVN
jgi:hypothetical protein